ncbi:MAG: putative selenate reductase subunit YgfK [bacterium]|nr:putative selenate reductase subunit YgfK [bacterium]
MSDLMQPTCFAELLNWMAREHRRHSSVFGVPAAMFHTPTATATPPLPFGPAAGPHTQLAQNIVAAFVCGARFFELKTVQILDDLHIAKPCIEAQDEGYNTEWSSELSVPAAADEYLKAWVALHVLACHLGLWTDAIRPFVFNMSVGYNLEGLKSAKVDAFIETLKNARHDERFAAYCALAMDCARNPLYTPALARHAIVAQVAPSVTLSTMHGCPPRDIENICRYLLQDKQLDVYVKLNPTLLGYETVRDIFRQCGFGALALQPASFEHDMQYADAVPMVQRLQAFAREHGRQFGVKLSNTLAVRNTRGVLPGEEMYLSGRALYPLTVRLAAQLARVFDGRLPISFSGGAHLGNLVELVCAGAQPVTLATDLLKPGGYYRLTQMAAALEAARPRWQTRERVDAAALEQLAEAALSDAAYQKSSRGFDAVQVPRALPLFDCYTAPCRSACPIEQDVPEYARLVRARRYAEALAVIYEKNPLPNITGHICDHACMSNCTRGDYEAPVEIRDLKRIAATRGFDKFAQHVRQQRNAALPRVAIIGAGPCGLATAAFLARAGFNVQIFEKAPAAGGVVQNAIPNFRLPQAAIDHDLDLLSRMGVTIQRNVQDELQVARLQQEGFAYVVLAIGAGCSRALPLTGDNPRVIHALEFLWHCRGNASGFEVGRRVAVVGGGNSAMDSARAAVRMPGVESVYLLYRRTIAEMPADREEFDNAVGDGVIVKELRLPVQFSKDGRLRCQVMALGAPDASGRRAPVAVPDQFEELAIDSVIAAIGETVDVEYLRRNGVALDARERLVVNSATGETSLPRVYIGGDALHGPATVVRAIADARMIADNIVQATGARVPILVAAAPAHDQDALVRDVLHAKRILHATHDEDGVQEAKRCLLCDMVCDKCVEVCPNRANIAVRVQHSQFKNRAQIVHLDGWCNECGNCATFCPYDGAPYKDKFTVFWSDAAFEASTANGCLLKPNEAGVVRLRVANVVYDTRSNGDGQWHCASAAPADAAVSAALALLNTLMREYPYLA